MVKKKKASEEKVEEKEGNIDFPYNVESLADRMDITPASVRVKLRNCEIPKSGKSYGWRTKREFEEVLKELESAPSAPANGAAKAKPSKKAAKEPDPPPKKKTLKRKAKASEGDEAAA